MLVIGRKLNESLILQLENGETIEIKITEIGNQVRLGVEAPKTMHIWRKELYLTLLENRHAAETVPIAALRSLVKTIQTDKGGKGQ